MRAPTVLTGLVLVAACTSVDITTELEATGTLLKDTRSKLEPELTHLAAIDKAQAEAALLANGEPIAKLEGCGMTDRFLLSRRCRIVSTIPPSLGDPVNAEQILTLLKAMDTYLAGVKLIATSADSDRVTQSAKALLAVLGEVDTKGPDALLPLAKAFEGKQDGAVGAVGFLAEQARMNSLRRIVNRADAILAEDLTVAASFFPEGDEIDAAREKLLEAGDRAKMLARAKDVDGYRRMLVEMKKRHGALIEMQRQSPAYALRTLREIHHEMAAKLSGSGNLQDVVESLQDIEKIVSGLRGGS